MYFNRKGYTTRSCQTRDIASCLPEGDIVIALSLFSHYNSLPVLPCV